MTLYLMIDMMILMILTDGQLKSYRKWWGCCHTRRRKLTPKYLDLFIIHNINIILNRVWWKYILLFLFFLFCLFYLF